MKHNFDPRIQKVQSIIMTVSHVMELGCAVILIIAILIALCKVPADLHSLYLDNGFDLDEFMRKSFELVIGVELLKMFCRHDIDSVVEVLLFAVARYIIIEHLPTFQILIGVTAIAILFLIRRFLFVSALDDPDGQEEKLAKDQYVKQRIAQGIAKYKKEMAATTLEEKASQSVHTAEPDTDKI